MHWREVAKLARPLPSAHFAVAWAEHDFTANVPLESLEDDFALLATHADGAPLTPDHGYPLRLVMPAQVLLEEREVADAASSCSALDRPGFWERLGYNNDADPWQEERFGF